MNIQTDMWTRLRNTQKPLVMYGTGNGADKIIAECERRGIEIQDFFVSDDFCRGQSFHGKRVMTYGEVCEKHGDFIILVAFGSRLPDVLDRVYSLSEKHELYAPDVPVSGGEIFDIDFYNKHKESFDESRCLLCDERSKLLFDDIINYKLSGDIKYLRRDTATPDEVWGLLHPEDYKVCCDLGAYDGDTCAEMLDRCPKIEKIQALEPDLHNFKKLSDFAARSGRIIPVNAAAWNENGELEFSSSGNRNAGIGAPGKVRTVRCARCDDIFEYPPDFIKLDVEGAEHEALLGCSETINKYSPDLCVSVYHKSRDLFDLPELVHNMCPTHSLYLRRYDCLPAWELVLIASKSCSKS